MKFEELILSVIRKIYSGIIFRLAFLFSKREIPTNDKVVYLTFDDGPEEDITEFVLDTLRKFNAKATFFCTGENYENHPDLVTLIKNDGHAFGNHTYSHINGLYENSELYIDDVYHSKKVIRTTLFRPPWGVLSIKNGLRISKDNKIFLWSISSRDSQNNIDWSRHCESMIKDTNSGSIVLFHFSHQHAEKTRQILPIYLKRITELGYVSKAIDI